MVSVLWLVFCLCGVFRVFVFLGIVKCGQDWAFLGGFVLFVGVTYVLSNKFMSKIPINQWKQVLNYAFRKSTKLDMH